MKLLILGGTMFLGRHLVEAALGRGHEVTLFNRGQHHPELFPEVEKLRGDRDGDLRALEGGRWDAVIDTCGYVPRLVRASAELLSGAVGLYVFISSISAYADFSQPVHDDSPLATTTDETAEEVTGENYGALKTLCEHAAREAMKGRVLVVRPGLIVGPHDTTDRFTYWARRVARGGEVLAPGNPERQVQIIDARDLSEWIVRTTERGDAGVYDATGPDHVLTMRAMLDECKNVCGSDARFTWASEGFLLEAGVAPWSELPLWMPEEDAEHRYFLSINCQKAFAAGLDFRPLAETVRDTLAWDAEKSDEATSENRGFGVRVLKSGLAPERERELLEAWHAQS
jgi:2'-hydroxyisoflavone reductase